MKTFFYTHFYIELQCSCFIESFNELGKRDKMQGLLSILSLFRNTSYKLNNTGAKNVKFYLSYDSKTTLKSCFCVKTLRFCYIYMQHFYSHQYMTLPKSVSHWWFIDIILLSISLPEALSYDKTGKHTLELRINPYKPNMLFMGHRKTAHDVVSGRSSLFANYRIFYQKLNQK